MKPFEFARASGVAFAAFFSVMASMSAQTSGARDEQLEVRKAVDAFYQAYNAHEFDKLPQFTTEDWTTSPRTGW